MIYRINLSAQYPFNTNKTSTVPRKATIMVVRLKPVIPTPTPAPNRQPSTHERADYADDNITQ